MKLSTEGFIYRQNYHGFYRETSSEPPKIPDHNPYRNLRISVAERTPKVLINNFTQDHTVLVSVDFFIPHPSE